jgi:hypothetical protein
MLRPGGDEVLALELVEHECAPSVVRHDGIPPKAMKPSIAA